MSRWADLSVQLAALPIRKIDTPPTRKRESDPPSGPARNRRGVAIPIAMSGLPRPPVRDYYEAAPPPPPRSGSASASVLAAEASAVAVMAAGVVIKAGVSAAATKRKQAR